MMCLGGLTIVPYCVLELVKQECFRPNSTYKRRMSLIHPYAPFNSSSLGSQKRGPGTLERAPYRKHPGSSPTKPILVMATVRSAAGTTAAGSHETGYQT